MDKDKNKKVGFVIGIDLNYIEPLNGAHFFTYSNKLSK